MRGWHWALFAVAGVALMLGPLWLGRSHFTEAARDGGAADLVSRGTPAPPDGSPVVDGGLRRIDGGVALGGRVLDEGGRGVAGATLTVGGGVRGTSDGEGRFAVDGLPPGEHVLAVTAAGFLPEVARVRAPGETTVSLRRAARVGGVVRDESGQPVAGARVVVMAEAAPAPRESSDGGLPLRPILSWSGTGGAAARLLPRGELGVLPGPIPYPPPAGAVPDAALVGVADAAGRFEIDGVPPGTVVLVASHPLMIDTRSASVTAVAGERAEAQMVMRRGLVARGRVTDERGAVIGAELWVGGVPSALTSGDGRFELVRLLGPTEVEVRARGHVPARAVVDPAKPDTEIHIASAAGRLTGVVIDERGFPVQGAEVRVEGGGGAAARATTDARGDFVVDGVGTGALRVVVATPRRPDTVVENAAAGEDVRVVLEPGGGVAGTVMEAAGGDLPRGLRLTVEDAARRRHAVTTDGRGRFEVVGLAPGPATVRAEAADYAPATVKITVPPGEAPGDVTVRDLRIDLAPGGAVVGTVTDTYGAPVAGAVVEGGGLTARTDAAGRYRLAPLAPGPARISTRDVNVDTTVVARQDVIVDLRVR